MNKNQNTEYAQNRDTVPLSVYKLWRIRKISTTENKPTFLSVSSQAPQAHVTRVLCIFSHKGVGVALQARLCMYEK